MVGSFQSSSQQLLPFFTEFSSSRTSLSTTTRYFHYRRNHYNSIVSSRTGFFIFPERSNSQLTAHQDISVATWSRREWVAIPSSLVVSVFLTDTLLNSNKAANAVVMDNSSDQARAFTAGEKLGKEAAIARFQRARGDLDYLVHNFDTIVSNGGGDNVRRYLGTVGVTSGLYGITKVLKELQEEADDIVTFTESMNDFDYYLRSADTACYSANFVEFSAAKTKPEKFFEDAKRDTQNMKVTLDRMASELRIQ